MSNDIENVRCTVLRETERGLLLQDAAAPNREDWFPKSQVSFRRRNTRTGEALAEIPLWLLDEKGWNS